MKSSGVTFSLAIEKHPDGYLAYFPALRGCHTWGTTYEAAVKNAEEALVGYLETLRLNGEEIPEEQPQAGIALGLMVTVPTIV